MSINKKTLNGISNTDNLWVEVFEDELGNPFDFTNPSDWTVTAQLFNLETYASAGQSAAQSKAHASADWPNGKIAIALPASATESIADGNYGLEVKAQNGGSVKRWHVNGYVEMKKGVIS